MIVEVELRPDQRDECLPARIRLGARWTVLTRIVDVWPGADHTYVKGVAEDGATWILRHDRPRDVWELTLYQVADEPALPERPGVGA